MNSKLFMPFATVLLLGAPGVLESEFVEYSEATESLLQPKLFNVWTKAWIIRIGFFGVFYCNYNKEPPKPYSNYWGPYSMNGCMWVPATSATLRDQNSEQYLPPTTGALISTIYIYTYLFYIIIGTKTLFYLLRPLYCILPGGRCTVHRVPETSDNNLSHDPGLGFRATPEPDSVQFLTSKPGLVSVPIF